MSQLFRDGSLVMILASTATAEKFLTSSADEQVRLDVTVYNNNLGLVKDT